MNTRNHITTRAYLADLLSAAVKAWIVVAVMALSAPAHAQHRRSPDSKSKNYSIADSLWANSEGGFTERDTTALQDSLLQEIIDSTALTAVDTIHKRHKRDWSTWRPNPKRAMWLALVLPGAGQIYNRKYWKLPIIYGGFVGCIYAMRWNNMMYKDYSQAYLDIMDDDPTTQSYNSFLHLGATVTEANTERYQEIFRKRKNRYRRWRELSFFCMLGVYAISVIDAYVDASLSEFDITPDLTMRWAPGVVSTRNDINQHSSHGLGLQMNFSF